MNVTFLNTHRNHIERSTRRLRFITMLPRVVVAKLAAVLVAGAVEVSGGPGHFSPQTTIGTSSSELPIDAGRNAMTPLGAVWLRMIDWLGWNATPQGIDPED